MVCASEGTTQPADKLKHKTLMKNNQLTLAELQSVAGGKSSSLGDVAKEVYTDLKNVAVFYGKWAGGVAGGKSWDRAAYDAGKEANIPGMGDNNPEK